MFHMKASARSRNLIQLLIAFATIAIIGYISELVHWRIDLTSEKRYTLSKVTKEMLSNLNDLIYIRIYLDGDLPIGFKRMQKSLTETLDEFRVYARSNLQYEYINPMEGQNPKARQKIINDLYEKGLKPTNIQDRDSEGGTTQKLVIPGALVSYRGKEVALNLLRNNAGLSGEENINLSIQNFEFGLVDAIRKLSIDSLPKVAFIQGHGELDQYETGDIERGLSEYYDVYRVEINGDVKALDPYSVVIVAGPTQPIAEPDKFVIDQYIMGGGKVLWFVDPVKVSIDSLSSGSTTLAFMNQHNLDDMLFRYGVRLNPKLIQDMQCALIPVNTSLAGQEPRFVPAPWVYYPLLSAPSGNPITRNLNLIRSQFVSPLDTLGGDGSIKKTILLRTSQYTRSLQVPLFVSLEQVSRSPLERDFNQSNLPVAVLLEGVFESNFRNRPLRGYNHGRPFNFREASETTRMIVVADADIIRNDVRRRPDGAYVMPLGFDRYSNQTFGNKELVLNMVKYLDDQIGLMELRKRDIKLRLLDKKKILQSRLKWQLINLVIPSALLILGGIAWFAIRRRLFARG